MKNITKVFGVLLILRILFVAIWIMVDLYPHFNVADVSFYSYRILQIWVGFFMDIQYFHLDFFFRLVIWVGLVLLIFNVKKPFTNKKSKIAYKILCTVVIIDGIGIFLGYFYYLLILGFASGPLFG